MSAEPDDYSDFDDFCDSAEDDEFEDAAMNCGLTQDGTCMAAGSEHCDWDCPFSRSGFRPRRSARKAHRPRRTEADHKYLEWKARR